MAASAGIADMCRVDGRSFIGVLDDLVLAVAVRAKGRLGDAAGQSLSVHAVAVLFHDVGVAHAAGIGDGGAESLRLGRQQFMGAAVAQSAVRRSVIAGLARLAVCTAGIVAGLFLVA